MFNVSFSGEINFEVKRIRDSYGYPDALDTILKRFVVKIGADKMVKVGLFYEFQLSGDKKREVDLFLYVIGMMLVLMKVLIGILRY